MAGHNKWSKIKRQKAGTDAAKSKIFSKLSQAIAAASREARGDINSPTLRSVIEKARQYNFPNENIERAVERGRSGKLN
jgi:transcriptional/translational regulatory protein YebC/TACO1